MTAKRLRNVRVKTHGGRLRKVQRFGVPTQRPSFFQRWWGLQKSGWTREYSASDGAWHEVGFHG